MTTALRSPTAGLRPVTRQKSASKTTQAAADMTTSTSERRPKRMTAAIRAGTSAIRTSAMILRVVSLFLIWGAAVTVKFTAHFPPFLSICLASTKVAVSGSLPGQTKEQQPHSMQSLR